MNLKTNEYVAYRCKTKELAKKFLEQCEKQGIYWASGLCATNYTHWDEFEEDTCYSVYGGNIRYNYKKNYKELDFKIIEYTEEM